MDKLGKIFHMNFLIYEHCFISIRILKLLDNYISVGQARYATSVVTKYLDTDTIRKIKSFIRLP